MDRVFFLIPRLEFSSVESGSGDEEEGDVPDRRDDRSYIDDDPVPPSDIP